MKIMYLKMTNFIFITIAIFVLFLVLIVGGLVFRSNKESIEVNFLPITNRIIGIDPGHGGIDPGAVGRMGTLEDEINLKIGLKLKRLIEQSGGIVIITRTTDEGLYSEEAKTLRQMKTEDLHKRKEIIDNSGCEIFISIHLNSFTKGHYYGAQTFYKRGSEESLELSKTIQEELKNILDQDNRRQPQDRDNVFLLNEIEIPTTLVECGFLSNEEEEKLLRKDEYQEKIAWAIYIGIINYFNKKQININ